MKILGPLAPEMANISGGRPCPLETGLEMNELGTLLEPLSPLLAVLRMLALELNNRAGYMVASQRPLPKVSNAPR